MILFLFVCLFVVVVVFFHILLPKNFPRVSPRVTVNHYVLSSYVCAMLLAVSVLWRTVLMLLQMRKRCKNLSLGQAIGAR